MSRENFPAPESPEGAIAYDPAIVAEANEVIAEHGGAEVFRDRFGLGLEELTQAGNWGPYKGSVAKMLADPRCPVGGMVETAYKDEKAGGLSAVKEKLQGLQAMDPSFNVVISEATETYSQAQRGQKKN